MSRHSVLDEIGDPSAPAGSRPWVIAILRNAQAKLKDMEADAQYAQTWLKMLREAEAWRALGYPSWGLLCAKELRIAEGEADAILAAKRGETLRKVIDGANNPGMVAKHGQHENSKAGKRVDQLGNTKMVSSSGTTADYLTARIARDRPDILERMKTGEYQSVHAAALEAGIVKKKVQIPLDPERASNLIRKHFTSKQVEDLIWYLTDAP